MPSPYGDHLSPAAREAVSLARDLREEIREWLARRGVEAPVVLSPFIDPSGQPNVLIRMNAYLARAMILSFQEQHGQAAQGVPPHSSHPRDDNGTYHHPPRP
jgi:hypothetical protein